ncbi:hypothetical protein CDD81_7145 [Ophiocordyceps australis]|uniref:Uncharacterized protein n=1 Tax=Ophiocordyceps australis TaxID=1399860 RepID=A0A2C5Y420_9HYPO|nr:hypothetical protein CDD81_7145 [Ophiocordyceps australis]
MGRDDDNPTADAHSHNVFIRFKDFVDSTIASGLRTLAGSPLTPSSSSHQIASSANLSPPTSAVMSSPLHSSAMSIQDVFSLFSQPPYCPSALRHLPPPVPNDLEPSHDSSIFTFEDAFEDLMVVSQGKPLPDINTRHDQRKLLRQMYPSGEPTWFFIQRLVSQGLMPSLVLNRSSSSTPPDWERFHHELNSIAAEAWQSLLGPQNGQHGTDGFFGEVASAISDLGGFGAQEQNSHQHQDDQHVQSASVDQQDPPEATTLEEFFSSIMSAFSTSQKSLGAFAKAIFDDGVATQQQQEGQQQQQLQEGQQQQQQQNVTFGPNQELKRVETRDEHVDKFGYRHTTVTQSILDAQGNQVGRQVYTTVRRAEPSQDGQADTDESNSSNDSTHDSKDNDDPGWFWK